MVRTSYRIASLSREGLPGPPFLEPTSAPFTLCPPGGCFPTEPPAGEWRTWAIYANDFTRRPPTRIPLSKTGATSPDSRRLQRRPSQGSGFGNPLFRRRGRPQLAMKAERQIVAPFYRGQVTPTKKNSGER